MARRNDWDAIERDYRTGRFTNVQLARRYDLSEAAIRKKAKEKGWQKDLTERVQESTRCKVNVSLAGPDLSDDEVVERASSENAGVIERHRKRLERWQRINDRAADILDEQLKDGTMRVLVKGQPIDVDIPLDYVAKAINSGTSSAERMIRAERVSYGLDTPENSDQRSLDQLIDDARSGDDGP